MKTKKKIVEEKVESLPTQIGEALEIAKSPSTTGQEVKITSFDGDFGRADINSLKDKVNEVIDYINK